MAAQDERGDTAIFAAAVDALPVAAICAGDPRPECGGVAARRRVEGVLQPEQRGGLVREALNYRRRRIVGEGGDGLELQEDVQHGKQ